jgi:hypothetical protein
MQTKARSIAAVIATALFAAPALAQPAACPLPYKVFEFAVAHIDLAACPKSAFCRATVGGDAVHVFVFAEDGEQCLRSVSSYETGKFALDIK